MSLLAVDNVHFSKHSAERWSERARPFDSTHKSLAELEALRSVASIEPSLPTATCPAGEPHLIIGDFRFPLVRSGSVLVAVTCKRNGPRPRPGAALAAAATSPSRRARHGGRPRPAYRRPHHVDWFDAHLSGQLDHEVAL